MSSIPLLEGRGTGTPLSGSPPARPVAISAIQTQGLTSEHLAVVRALAVQKIWVLLLCRRGCCWLLSYRPRALGWCLCTGPLGIRRVGILGLQLSRVGRICLLQQSPVRVMLQLRWLHAWAVGSAAGLLSCGPGTGVPLHARLRRWIENRAGKCGRWRRAVSTAQKCTLKQACILEVWERGGIPVG